MKSKSTKIIYWISTGLLALLILPGIFFLNSPMALEGTRHLGMPHWFHEELGIGKFIGGLILILPMIPARIKEWAYCRLWHRHDFRHHRACFGRRARAHVL